MSSCEYDLYIHSFKSTVHSWTWHRLGLRIHLDSFVATLLRNATLPAEHCHSSLPPFRYQSQLAMQSRVEGLHADYGKMYHHLSQLPTSISWQCHFDCTSCNLSSVLVRSLDHLRILCRRNLRQTSLRHVVRACEAKGSHLLSTAKENSSAHHCLLALAGNVNPTVQAATYLPSS